MHDPFVGTWELSRAGSQFDPKHNPARATMRWERDGDGSYLMFAEGENDKGEPCVEKPQRLRPDGLPYPVDNLPGLQAVTSRPDANTIRAEARRDDGSLAGEGTYVVAPDGASLTATTSGFDSQLRRFEMRTLWHRVGGSRV